MNYIELYRMESKKVIKSPEYGVAFRMEDYHRKLEQGTRTSNEKNTQDQTQVIPAPIKTARRQQTESEDILPKQNKPTVGPEIQAQKSCTGKGMVLTVSDPKRVAHTALDISLNSKPIAPQMRPREMSVNAIPIRDTKLTASEMSELVRRRLPASEVFKMENPAADKSMPDRRLVVIHEPIPVTHEEAHNPNSDPSESNEKTINKSSPGWQFAKCMCCAICGCSVCTTLIGTCFLLCYEWFG